MSCLGSGNQRGRRVLSAEHILAGLMCWTDQYVEHPSQLLSLKIFTNLHACPHCCNLRIISTVQGGGTNTGIIGTILLVHE